MDIISTGDHGRVAGVRLKQGQILVVPMYYNEPHAIQACLKFYENYRADVSTYTEINYGVMVRFLANVTVELNSLDLGILFLPWERGSYEIIARSDEEREAWFYE